MTREDRAWAAGLFEGEGCFSPRRPSGKKSMHLHAGLVSTDEDVVRRFAAIVGVGFMSEVRPRLPHHKPAWGWQANGEAVEHVYALLELWLGERRKARYAELLNERREYEIDRDSREHSFPRFASQGLAFTQGRLP